MKGKEDLTYLCSVSMVFAVSLQSIRGMLAVSYVAEVYLTKEVRMDEEATGTRNRKKLRGRACLLVCISILIFYFLSYFEIRPPLVSALQFLRVT